MALADDGIDFFERRIRPVLVEHCYACHSSEAARKKTLKGELQLDTHEGVRRGGSSGPAVVPGKVEDSLLISAITHESFEMPPTGKLSEAVIADFIKWVEIGAPDPRDEVSRSPIIASGVEQARRHWAFLPPSAPATPDVTNAAWPLDDLDRFVLARLEGNGLTPAQQADRFLRAVSFQPRSAQ